MLTEKRIYPSPWLADLKWTKNSADWTLDDKNAYFRDFLQWFQQLEENEKKQYQSLFPKPKAWNSYENQQEQPCYHKERSHLVFWRADGTPQFNLSQVRKDYLSGKKQKFLFF